MTTSDRMTPGEQRSVFVGVLVMAIMVLGMALLFSLSGCATVRKTVAATATASRLTVEVTRDVCRTLADSWCKVNPCPELERCHLAEKAFIAGASAFVQGAKHINTMPKELLDARP